MTVLQKQNQSWILALIGGEFKRAVMNKLSELNSEMKFSELRNKDNEEKKYFTKEIFSIKRFYRDFL